VSKERLEGVEVQEEAVQVAMTLSFWSHLIKNNNHVHTKVLENTQSILLWWSTLKSI